MSSFIFVVILAVWAVYLVQHWVRRRDHLATARSVDRFSESMRVLERRRSLPRPDLAEHAPPTTSVLLRPARPEVVVKRGESAAPSGRKVATAVGPTSTHRHARLRAKVRAACLLAASLMTITLVVLTMTQVLHWAWSFAGLGVLALTVLAVRWSVSRDRSARASTARPSAVRRPQAGAAVARREAPAVARQEAPAAARRGAPATDSSAGPALDEHAASPLSAQARALVAAPSSPARRAVDIDRRPEPVLYDVDRDGVAAHSEPAPAPSRLQVAQDLPDADLAPDAWSPVPVPPPTYTLKARAHQGVAVAPTGSTELPLDGTEMALDEEFEDLPSVDRVS